MLYANPTGRVVAAIAALGLMTATTVAHAQIASALVISTAMSISTLPPISTSTVPVRRQMTSKGISD